MFCICWKYVICFWFWFYRGLQLRDCLESQERLRLWTFKLCWDCESCSGTMPAACSLPWWSWTLNLCSLHRGQKTLLVFWRTLSHILYMPFLWRLLWLQVLCAGPLHTETVVFLVPADDGRAVLLWSWFLHPPAHVSTTTYWRAHIQCVLHQAATKSCSRSAANGAAILHWPWRTRDESCWQYYGNGIPGPAQFIPRRHNLPTPSFLLQHTSTPLRTGGEGQVARCYMESKGDG